MNFQRRTGFCVRIPRIVCLALLLTAISLPAWASLGDKLESVADDANKMKASVRVIPAQGYAVHEIHAPTGQVVREFVFPTGSVFAVEWDGAGLFDLRQILGAYFEQYKLAMAQTKPHGNTPVSLRMPGFVFHLAGNMSSFHGQAYIPQDVPANFDFSSSHSARNK